MPMKTATFRPLSALLGPLGPMAGCISSISTQQTQRHLQNRLPDRFRGPDWTPLNGPGGVYFSEPKGFVKVYSTRAQSALVEYGFAGNFLLRGRLISGNPTSSRSSCTSLEQMLSCPCP